MKTNHISVPWTVEVRDNMRLIWPEKVEHVEIEALATVWGATRDPDAIARLIAAAPELLEALRTLLAVSGPRVGAPEHELMAHRAARAAIEKAEGKR